jgi:hypothetical protein
MRCDGGSKGIPGAIYEADGMQQLFDGGEERTEKRGAGAIINKVKT